MHKPMLKSLAGAAGIAMLAAIPLSANAEGGMHGPRAHFERADTDKDGAITLDELKASHGKRFTEIDKDGDGVVTSAEATAHAQERAKKHADHMLKRVDKDGDGTVSKAEFEAGAERMFARLDANGDGKIEKGEPRMRHGDHSQMPPEAE